MSELNDPIEIALQSLRKELPNASARQIAAAIVSKTGRRRQFVTRFTISATVIAGGFVAAILTLAPRPAMASLGTVTRYSLEQKVYFSVVRSHHIIVGRYDSVSELETWQFRNRVVQTSSVQSVDHRNEPRLDVRSSPKYVTTSWEYPSGKWITLNAICHGAVEFAELPMSFPKPDTLEAILAQPGKVVKTTPNVSAHGGVFDMYEINGDPSQGKLASTFIYADPATHLIRFYDVPGHTSDHLVPSLDVNGMTVLKASSEPGDFLESSEEFQYMSEAELEASAPSVPNSRKASEDRARFLREIPTAIATQWVGGIQVKLHGVVLKRCGEIVAILSGSAPRDEEDSREIQILGVSTRFFHGRPPYIGAPLIDPAEPTRRFVRTYPIGGKQYVTETTRQAIVGKMPTEITLKVPVWRFDKSKPAIRFPQGTQSRTWPSKFVGYATFTTRKIYEMPGGVGNGQGGAPLPSDY